MSKFDPLHVQCAVKQQYQPVFTGTNQPRLLYVSNIRPQTSMYPRMLHAHADAVELALMYSGSGKFFIHDRYVPIIPASFTMKFPARTTLSACTASRSAGCTCPVSVPMR